MITATPATPIYRRQFRKRFRARSGITSRSQRAKIDNRELGGKPEVWTVRDGAQNLLVERIHQLQSCAAPITATRRKISARTSSISGSTLRQS